MKRRKNVRRKHRRSNPSHPVWAGIGTFFGTGIVALVLHLILPASIVSRKIVKVLLAGVVVPGATYAIGRKLFSPGAKTGVLVGAVTAGILGGAFASAAHDVQVTMLAVGDRVYLSDSPQGSGTGRVIGVQMVGQMPSASDIISVQLDSGAQVNVYRSQVSPASLITSARAA